MLLCPTSVTRASTAVCVASASEVSATVVISAWHFDPDSSALGRVDRSVDVTDLSWPGPMATSGIVVAKGTVGGRPDSALAHIEVTARDWSTEVLGLDLRDISPDTLPDQPLNEHQLGVTDLSYRLDESTLLPAMMTVPNGPNRDYMYFAAIPFRAKTDVAINTRALAEGTVFYSNQERQRRVVNDSLFCDRTDVTGVYLPGVQAHEGLRGRSDVNSHVAIYVDRLEREARARIEGMVSTSREEFPAFSTEFRNMVTTAQDDSKAMDDEKDGRNPFVAPCYMHYFVSSRGN